MNQGPKITAVEITSFEFSLNQVGRDHNGFNLVFEPGGKLRQEGSILQIHTDQGVSGEFPIGPGRPNPRSGCAAIT